MTMLSILAMSLFAVAAGVAFGGRRTLPKQPSADSPDTEVSLGGTTWSGWNIEEKDRNAKKN